MQRTRTVGLLLAAILISGVNVNIASAQNLRPEFGPIAKDDFAFLHVRVADLWTSDIGGKLREKFSDVPVLQQGRLEQIFGFGPANVDSVTFVMPTAEAARFLGREDHWTPADVTPAKQDPAEKFKDEKKEKEPGQPPFETDDKPRPPTSIFIVTTVKPFDRDRVTRGIFGLERPLLPREEVDMKPVDMKHNGKTYRVSRARHDQALHFLDERTFLVASSPAFMKKVLERSWQTKAQGPLAPALELAMKNHSLVIGINMEDPTAQSIRKDRQREQLRGGFGMVPLDNDPSWAFAPLRELLAMRSAAAAIDMGKASKLQATLTFANEKQAASAGGNLQDALVVLRLYSAGLATQMVRDGLEDGHEAEGIFMSLMVKQMATGLRGGKVEVKQASVQLTVQGQLDVATLYAQAKAEAKALTNDPVFQTAKQRRISGNNLKQIMLAMQAHNDTYRALPPGAICSKKDGKPLLSWRVAILPFIEQDALYREFKLDEPWDSAHNIKLLPRMPKTYAPVGIKTKEPYSTFYQAFVGPGAVFEIRPDAKAMFGAKGINLGSFADGTSNTIGVVEASVAVPWTKPAELVFDGKNLPKVGGTQFEGGFHGGTMDGVTWFFESRIDAATLRAIITHSGGEKVDWVRFTER